MKNSTWNKVNTTIINNALAQGATFYPASGSVLSPNGTTSIRLVDNRFVYGVSEVTK